MICAHPGGQTAPSDSFAQISTVQGLFAAQAIRSPHAIALIAGDRQLTYRELDERANALSLRLRNLGAVPGELVGIALERSIELYIGLLAILKSGAAYLPLDPTYPSERLAFMLHDAVIPLVLTSAQMETRLPLASITTIHPDDAPPVAAASPVAGNGNDPAYVIYTSGSTGTPKGVLVPQRALVNHNLAIGHTYGLQPGDRVLQFASPSFDVAAEEIFPTWATGATVVAAPEAALHSVGALLDFAERESLTVLNLPTPYWHEWVNQLERGAASLPASVRLVVVGSDTARPDRLAAWQRLVGDRVRWVNAYGPTEATITTTIYAPTSAEIEPQARTVPVRSPDRQRRSICSTTPWHRCPTARLANSTSAARDWRSAAISTVLNSPPSASSPIRSPRHLGNASTAPATSRDAARTATSSSWAASTSR
ncbi:MAG: AMP-binding protein [Chloroflexia bacterium]